MVEVMYDMRFRARFLALGRANGQCTRQNPQEPTLTVSTQCACWHFAGASLLAMAMVRAAKRLISNTAPLPWSGVRMPSAIVLTAPTVNLPQRPNCATATPPRRQTTADQTKGGRESGSKGERGTTKGRTQREREREREREPRWPPPHLPPQPHRSLKRPPPGSLPPTVN